MLDSRGWRDRYRRGRWGRVLAPSRADDVSDATAACGCAARSSSVRCSFLACKVTPRPRAASHRPASSPRPVLDPLMNTRAMNTSVPARVLHCGLLRRRRPRRTSARIYQLPAAALRMSARRPPRAGRAAPTRWHRPGSPAAIPDQLNGVSAQDRSRRLVIPGPRTARSYRRLNRHRNASLVTCASPQPPQVDHGPSRSRAGPGRRPQHIGSLRGGRRRQGQDRTERTPKTMTSRSRS